MSLRKTNSNHPRHRYYLPYKEYLSTDILPVKEAETYGIDIEMWPTNVVVEKRGKLIFEVSSGDTQGCDHFKHTSEVDRYGFCYYYSLLSGTNAENRPQSVLGGMTSGLVAKITLLSRLFRRNNILLVPTFPG